MKAGLDRRPDFLGINMRINFYGGPGVGKSTLAAATFVDLKKRGHSVELIQEWIKYWAYIGRKAESFDNLYVFANQLHQEDRLLQAGVERLVTDSPLYLQCCYATLQGTPFASELWEIARQFEEKHPSINFFVERTVAYRTDGRYETPEQATETDEFIRTFLEGEIVQCISVTPENLSLVQYTLARHGCGENACSEA